jgi:hypothetical protein
MASSEVSFATSDFFVQLPECVVFNPNLSARAVRLYAALVKFAGAKEVCWPGQKTLAEMIGCSERYVRTLVKQLVAEGVISYKRGSYGRPNVYRLLVRVIHKVSTPVPAASVRNINFRSIRNRSAAESYSPSYNHGNKGRGYGRNSRDAGAAAYMRRMDLMK